MLRSPNPQISSGEVISDDEGLPLGKIFQDPTIILTGASSDTDNSKTATADYMGQGTTGEESLMQKGERIYQEALSATGEKKKELFISSANYFEQAAAKEPGTLVEQRALFHQGEALFFADHYDHANKVFSRLLKKYPKCRFADIANARRFTIAKYWEERHQKEPLPPYMMNLFDPARPINDMYGNSIRTFNHIRLDDPTGELADDATLAAGNAAFAQKDYFMADRYYGDLRDNFPDSAHQYTAHLLSVKTKLKLYRGSEYSSDPLVQSKSLIEKMIKQFPERAQQDQEYLKRAYAEVRYRLAEREWKMGQYYGGRAEYRAARIYYEKIIEEYHDTPFAAKAKAEMDQLVGKADVPSQKLKWLVDIFPESDELNATPKRSRKSVYDQVNHWFTNPFGG